MYLKALEINGFKSFAKKGHFDFTSRISAIVGPNGSGKSNVAEAFRFVLGEQSLKNMRSKKGTDLLFAGKGGQVNKASVGVTLDNSDRTLDIDYNEVTVERAVFRDGSNEYYINKNKVRAKDVVELLARANVGSTGHHIISQGEADKILTVSPRERKQIIEDALGLKVYTLKKAEAVRKLDKTTENLKEVKTEERASLPKLNYLKREVEKIEKARNLRDELRTLYYNYFPRKQSYQQELENHKQAQQTYVQEIEGISERIAQVKQEMNSDSQEEANQELARKLAEHKQQLQELRHEKNICDRELGKLEAVIEIELTKEKQSNASQNLDGKVQQLGVHLHSLWQEWSRPVLEEEQLSQARKERWENKMIGFSELSEDDKEEYREQADKVWRDVNGEVGKLESFNPEQLYSYQDKKEKLIEKYQKIEEQEATLVSQIAKLEQGLQNPELANQKKQIDILELEKQKSQREHSRQNLQVQIEHTESKLKEFQVEETHAQSIFGYQARDFFNQSNTQDTAEELNIHEKIIRTRTLLEHAGSTGGEEVITQYQELKKQTEYIQEQMRDLEATAGTLNELITDLEKQIEEKFRAGMEQINNSFNTFFTTLFSGGHASLEVINVPINGSGQDGEMQEYDLGVEMSVSLPNKKVSSLTVLSGGERSLTSIALLFAMSQVAPPPFIILDETDAALDEANSKRYGDMVEKLAEHSQLIVITHNRETMSRAGVLYGVTMGDDGVSRLLSVSFDEAQQVAK